MTSKFGKPHSHSESDAIATGAQSAAGKRFAIIAGRWHPTATKNLIEGARHALLSRGASSENISVLHVPGSFEIPLACKRLADTKSFDALITLGVVVRGETDHYRLIVDGLVQGVMQVMIETGIPIGFGVLAADSMEQIEARAHKVLLAGAGDGSYELGGENKGEEAALAALEMVEFGSEYMVSGGSHG